MKPSRYQVLAVAAIALIAAVWGICASPRKPASKLVAAPQPGIAAKSSVAAALPAPATRPAPPLANVDLRPMVPGHETRQAKLEKSRATRLSALKKLQDDLPGVRVDLDETLGSPKFIASTRGFLASGGGDGRAAVETFLNGHTALFGHGASVLHEARLVRDYDTPGNGMHTFVWQQQLDGLRVFESTLQAHVTKDGDLINVASRLVPDPAAVATLPTRIVDVKAAISAAGKDVGETDGAVIESGPAEGPAAQQKFRGARLLDVNAEKVWLPLDEEDLRLCWEVTFKSKTRGEMFRTLVDAEKGEVLVRQGLTEYLSNASYRVFTSDSPSPMSPGLATPGTTQPTEVARTLMTLSALDTTASPSGWIDDGINETRGNNVDAHLDLNADDLADTPRPQGSPSRLFDFTFDSTQAPSAYRDAAVTELFYWNNYIHDRYYQLGFTEAAGNFQINNFSKGGTGNDAVQADAQDGSGTNNANFSTPTDGSSGRMQMYVFTGPTPDRDGDFDQEVVIHEYTHGLSNRLVGGGVGISALQPRGMGEGWSDFYALCLLSQPTDDANAVYASGAYASYQLGGLTQNYYFGIRRYPYCTDLAKNPLTFKDIDPAQASAHTGIAKSPIIGSTANEVHNMGEVWCVTLWEARANLIAKFGSTAGNNLILQLVTDGMKLAPANPNFLQARDAIIQADLVDNAGANRNELWTAFAKRGMGTGASSPVGSTTTGLVENTDVPDDLGVTPVATFAAAGETGGPFAPSTQTYTLSNSGAAAVSWMAAKTQSWLTLSASSGTLVAGASTTVTATINATAAGLAAGNYADTVTFHNNASDRNFVRTVSLTISPPRIYFNSLDADPSWTRAGQWAFGQPTGGGGALYGYHDPTSGATGANVFGVNLVGDYSTTVGGPYYLTTPAINLASYGGTRLQFRRWLNTDYQPWAYATIEVSTNGTTWTSIWNNGSTTVADAAWTKVQYDISAVADNQATVYVRWGYQIGLSAAYAYSGWNIDDVEILGTPLAKVTVALPASATEGDAPLTGTVTASPAPLSDLEVNLVANDPTRLSVPASVTIAAGTTGATFPAIVIDNALLDGSKNVSVTPSAPGWTPNSGNVTVHDNETAVLTLNLPASTTEGAGNVAGTVTASAPVGADVVVQLTSNDTTELTVPASVTIPAGQTSAAFGVTILNDTRIDGSVISSVTAHVANWTDGSAAITVFDNETANLALALPTSVLEGDTGKTGSISLSGTLANDCIVALSSDNPAKIIVPASVTILAGQTGAAFPLIVVDDTATDGAQTVNVSATTNGFTAAAASVVVQDNDARHFTVAPIASPQVSGVAFGVSITAKDVNDATITNYNSVVTLSATGDNGAVAISPTNANAFANGVWTGNVTAGAFGTNVFLTVSDGAGHTGASNSFDVVEGQLDHFAWSVIASPQTMDTPFTATLTALDAGNNPTASFGGTANLSALITTANAAIGVGTNTSIIPFYGSYAKSRTQAIYLASEMGGAAPLNSVALYVGTSSTGTFSNWTIRLKHTTQSSYTTGSWDGTGWTVVHQGNAVPSAAGWLTFNFATPFDYNGTSNLLVDFSFNNASANGLTAYSRYTTGTTRAEYGYSSSVDPLTWSGTTGATPFTTTAVPNVQFTAERPVAMRPAGTDAFSGGVWTGSVSVPFSATSARLAASDGAGHSGNSNSFAVNVPAGGSGGAGSVFTENFESGALGSAWASTGTNTFRTQISTANTPHGGARHLTMDSSVDGSYSRNEATLTVNLAGRTGVQLTFWAKMFNDEANGPPTAPFTNGADFDGVAMSANGTTWWEVQSLRTPTISGSWAQFTVNLDAAIASRGIAYNSAFKIRFNQYDDYTITTDGIAIDDIAVTATPVSVIVVNVPTQATEGAGALSASVTLPAAQAGNTVVNLASNSPAKVTVPASVTILAGQLTASFALIVLDDAVLDGNKTVSISAAAVSLTGATVITVNDNESATLSVSMPATATEGVGSVTGTVTVSAVPAANITVNLTSNDTTEATVPATVTVPVGQTSATFTITVVDDTLLDGAQSAVITASVAGWTSGAGTISILDNEPTNLALSLPTVNEGGTATGTVSVSGTLASPLLIALSSANPARLTVPTSVTIPAGSSSASFTLTGVENALTDGAASVNVTASLNGFTSATSAVTVYDNDLHHFSVSSIATSQTVNVPFSVYFYAQTVDNNQIYGFNGPAFLNVSASGILLPITPSSVTFSGGYASTSASVNGVGTGAGLSVSSGIRTGTSNSFNVGAGPLDHFTVSNIASPQTIGTPFAVTLSAKDASNNTTPSFTGTAALRAVGGTTVTTTGTGGSTYGFIAGSSAQEREQVLYLASEVGPAGKITALAFQINGYSAGSLSNFTIRLKHSPLISQNAATGWDATGWTTVYQGTMAVATGNSYWLNVPLTGSFQYDGTSNLLVDISHNGGIAGTNAFSTQAAVTRVLWNNGSGYADPLTWSGTSDPAPKSSPGVPNMRVQTENLLSLAPATTGSFVNGVWSGNVAINQNGTGITLRADNGNGVVGNSNTFTVSGAPVLGVTPATGLIAAADFSGPATPASASWILSNSGTGTMTWTAAKTAPWLTLTSTGGTLAPGASTTVMATINTAGITPGNYTDTITFTNASTAAGNTTRGVALTVTLPAPMLAAEPPITGGISNSVSWSAVPGASAYEVQAADNVAFTNAVSSGWITATAYTFSPLTDATWRYRVRSRLTTPGAASSWSQTSQADFAADTAVNVSTSANPGRVVLNSSPSGSATLTEYFDEPGTAWSSTQFANVSAGIFERVDLSGAGPNTTPPLPVNQGGDLEARLTGTKPNALMADVAANRFSDGLIEAYLAPGNQTTLHYAGLLLRASRTSSMLNGYGAIIIFYSDGTVKADFSRIINGGDNGTGNWFYTSTAPFSLAANENLHAKFSVSGPTLSLRLWRVAVNSGVVTETAIPFYQGSNTLTATDSTYTSGLAGLYDSYSNVSQSLFDDVTVTLPGTSYSSAGSLTSTVLVPTSLIVGARSLTTAILMRWARRSALMCWMRTARYSPRTSQMGRT